MDRTRHGRPNRRTATGRRTQRQAEQPTSSDLQARYDRYVALAREAASLGDLVQMEHWYQHAEHYLRAMKERPI